MRTRSTSQIKKTKSSAQKKMSLECEAVECNFQTPTLDVKEYDAMVRHLQLHTVLVHGVEVAGVAGAGKTPPPSSEKQRARTRSRSRRRSNVEELDFPCPDCNLQSFATEAGLYMHRKRSCGLRGVEPSGLDFPCQGEGCGRAFSNPMGLAQHRSSCKKLPEVVQGDDNSREGEERSRKKRSRSEKTTSSSWSSERAAAPVQRSATSTNRRSATWEEASSSKRRRSDKSMPGNLALGDIGGETTSRSSERGVAPVQRSATFSEGVSSSSKRDAGERRGEDSKVEMEVIMALRDGKFVTTKYRVSSQAMMQSVIQKVATKMEREAKEVKLYKQANFGCDLEVDRGTLAVNYGGSRLVAKVVQDV